MGKTVLFVCEFNSCRSQLAEAIARQILPFDWRVLSAGLTRTIVSEEVLRSLAEVNIDPSGLSSKSLDQVRAETIDEVFVLAAPATPLVLSTFPNATVIDWTMEDPLRTPGGTEAIRAAIRAARDTLMRRLRERFLASG